MRPYKITLAAGGAQDVPAAGSYIYAIATPGGPVTVHAYDVNGALVLEGSLHAGRGLLCPPFVRLHVENGSTAQLIEIQAGFGQVQDVGLVSVAGVVETSVDMSRSFSGVAYAARLVCPPSVGNYSAAELTNPAGSGKVIIITNVDMGVNSASPTGLLHLSLGAGALAGLWPEVPASLLPTGPDTVAQLRWENAAVHQALARYVANVECTAGQPAVPLALGTPVLLPEGYSLRITGPIQTDIRGNVRYFERPV